MTTSAFATKLRQLRLAAGMSITKLAERAHYSKSHLSKIERGEKRPNMEIARRCDAALGSGSTLADLLKGEDDLPVTSARDAAPSPGDDVLPMAAASGWVIRLSPDGSGQVAVSSRPGREYLDNPAFMSWTRTPAVGTCADVMLDAVLDNLRTMARSVSPAVVFPPVLGVLQATRIEAAGADGQHRMRLMRLLGRGAELAGWLAQELGDEQMATWWTDQATEVASAVGDSDLWAYSLVRKSLLAIYRRDHRLASELATAAANCAGASSRTIWLATQRLAQCHALAGETTPSLRAVDRAMDMLSTLDEPTERDTVLTQLVSGWCLYELGFLDQAVTAFDAAIPLIDAGSVRLTARFSVRQALAHAAVGNVERSCHIVEDVAGDVAVVDSATIRSDLHLLANGLHRWIQRPQVAQMRAHLVSAMQGRRYP